MANAPPVRRYLGYLPGVLDLLRKEVGGCVAPRFGNFRVLRRLPVLQRHPASGQMWCPYRAGGRARRIVRQPLAGHDPSPHAPSMFVVTGAEAAAIRTAFEQRGELSVAVELRRLFPAVTDTAQARACARTIAGWKPLPAPRCSVPRDARGDATPLHRPDCGTHD